MPSFHITEVFNVVTFEVLNQGEICLFKVSFCRPLCLPMASGWGVGAWELCHLSTSGIDLNNYGRFLMHSVGTQLMHSIATLQFNALTKFNTLVFLLSLSTSSLMRWTKGADRWEVGYSLYSSLPQQVYYPFTSGSRLIAILN